MENATAIVLVMGLLPLLFATACTGKGEGGENGVKLRIDGSSGTRFSGSCTVGDGEPEEIGGEVPKSFTYNLGGKPLRCEISSVGAVEVSLTHGDTRSVQRFGGGALNLTYENGSVSASTSSQVIRSSDKDGEEAGAAAEPSDVASESRDVSGFDEVELRGVGNLSIRQTGSESLTVEAEESILPRLETRVRDNRLTIGPEPNAEINPTRPIEYTLTVKDLRALELSGTGSIVAEGIKTGELAVIVKGAGGVQISGEADSQDIRIVGVGNYQAGDLRSKEVKIDVAGTGRATVNASETLEAKVSGAGSVEYVGDPTVDKDVSGVGRVSRR